MKTRDYDSTVARMAGNIAGALVGQFSLDTIPGVSVKLARDIIAEVKRTELARLAPETEPAPEAPS